MAHIFVTRKIPQNGLDLLLTAGHTFTMNEKDSVLTKSELISALQSESFDGILSLLTDTIDNEVLDAAPNVKIVSNYAVGYNNIDLGATTARGITVTNTPGILTETVAEFTMAMILAIVKRIPEADRFTRSGEFAGWAPELLLGTDLKGKTLGILGAGRIGQEVAKIAALGFGMKIIYNDMKTCTTLEEIMPCTFMETTEQVLAEADIVSIHVPLLPTTHHLINAERLAMMKKSAYLINTSRGPIVDEVALVSALQNKTIAGAAIDVFEFEPVLTVGLTALENVIITPHTASASVETRAEMARLAGESLVDFFNGTTPKFVVTA